MVLQLKHRFLQRPETPDNLLYSFRTIISAYDAFTKRGYVLTDQGPTTRTKFIKGAIAGEEFLVDLGKMGTYPLSFKELSELIQAWPFSGDNTCDTCGNQRLIGKRIAPARYRPKIGCYGKRSMQATSPFERSTCKNYIPSKQHRIKNRQEVLPDLIQETVYAERIRFLREILFAHQVTHNNCGFEPLSEQGVIEELSTLSEDYTRLSEHLSIIKKPGDKTSLEREQLIHLLTDQGKVHLRGNINLPWDLSELRKALLQHERQRLVRIIEIFLEQQLRQRA